MRPGWLWLLALASCAPAALPETADTARSVPRPTICHSQPDGRPPAGMTADRGIGGTGAPAGASQARLQTSVLTADRGIGGTGIIGVITGFASVCVAGEEIALGDNVPVRVDDRQAALADLRAGQVAALAANGAGTQLSARSITVMHVVVGPVDEVSAQEMTVAGQQVELSGATGPALHAKVGDWVAVSGLRRPNGIVAATRIDTAPAGPVLVRGELEQAYGAARIGTLAVRLPDNARLPRGWSVTVTGAIEGHVLVADSSRIDAAGVSPSSYFGPEIDNFIVEAYVMDVPGGFLVDHDFVSGPASGNGIARRRIVMFHRDAAGRLTSASSDFESGGGFDTRRDFFPGSMPGGGPVQNSGPSGDDDDTRSRSQPAPRAAPPGGNPHR